MSNKPAGAGRSSFDLIDPARFFSNIKIHPGAHILDAGCGVGRYSIELSKLLDDKGVIYAVDDWDEGLDSLRNAIRENGLSNINPIKADITAHIPLGNGSIDLCLMATVLHDLPPGGQDSALREIARVLKPDGVFALVEFKKIDKGPGPPIGIRISEQEAEEKIAKYGFSRTYLGEIGEFNYLLTLRKTT
ncbi:MAG: class I SAM-dependent methyltransferase [Deltaproteobacteria bacterium]|nr:class I SAM-dependent methyltransferase [Deltaproteobacteria bacterium]